MSFGFTDLSVCRGVLRKRWGALLFKVLEPVDWNQWLTNKCFPISSRSSLPSLTPSKVLSSSPSTVRCAERWVFSFFIRHADTLSRSISNSAPRGDLSDRRSLRQVGFVCANVALVSGSVRSHGCNTSGSDVRRISVVFMFYVAAPLLHNAVW